MTSTDEPLGAHHYTDDEMHNEDVAHEHSDVNFRTVLASGTALLVVIAVSALLMYGLMRFLESQAAANDPQLSPLAESRRDAQGTAPADRRARESAQIPAGRTGQARRVRLDQPDPGDRARADRRGQEADDRARAAGARRRR